MEFRSWLSRFLLGLLIYLVWHHLAQAHGAAAWIMDDARTSWCCGPRECLELPDGAVKHLLGGGFVLNEERFPELGQGGKTYPSINEHYWGCFNGLSAKTGAGAPTGKPLDVNTDWMFMHPHCLFVPAVGT
jgi:hypothetical protein